MLVRITEKCTMGCSHCMVGATPDGVHMSTETFIRTVNWILEYGDPSFRLMLMSGGEPTEHPRVLDFIRYSRVRGIPVLLLSNGEFLHEEGELRDAILEEVQGVQVTNDPRFYPRHVLKFDHPKVFWETAIQGVSPHGRAVANKLPVVRVAPECFNLRSLVRALGSYRTARLHLMARGKMCTPSVNVDGSISAGESSFCTKIGTVDSTESDLVATIQKMRCSKCGLVANMAQAHKAAIGEDR